MAYKMSTRACAIGSLSAEDKSNFTQWVWEARHKNCFDPDTLSYPRAVMLTAEDNDGPALYLPVHPVLMLESLAPRPDLSSRKEAVALWKLGEMLNDLSRDTGLQEQVFLCKDPEVVQLCADHGFEKMEGYTILKRKVPVIELPKETT